MTALQVECRVLESLSEALARQRAGVAADDAAQVDAATHAVSRSLLTLEEAKRRRSELVEALGGARGGQLASLEDVLGPMPRFTEARENLRARADQVVQELAVNQKVLQRAVRSGEAYLQAMFAPDTGLSSGYASTRDPADCPARGVLLNKSA